MNVFLKKDRLADRRAGGRCANDVGGEVERA